MFRKGELLKCIKWRSDVSKDYDLEPNKIYVVDQGNSYVVYLKNLKEGYCSDRFEKVFIGIFGKL